VAKNIMNIQFKILDTDSQINSKILSAIIAYLQPIFDKVESSTQKILPIYVKQALFAEPEYVSLLSGQLRSELGVPDADSRINRLFDAWSSNVNLRKSPLSARAGRLSGGFSLDIIKSDFSDVLSLPESIVVDDTSGSTIPWLRWLLLDGNKILIRNYTVQMGNNPRSRTGSAIMVSSQKINWRVPAQFAGTVNNNWVTRAIERLDDSLLQQIEKELERYI
jgi:hypothetical protein